MPRTYVNNSYNRSVGRVGMTHGTAVISSSSGGGGGGGSSYASSGGGVSSASTSTGTYVDNAYNRSVGRVGQEHGTAVISRGCGSVPSHLPSQSSVETYVDSAYNRSVGRVGLPLGSMVMSRSSGEGGNSTSSSQTVQGLTYIDNAYNRNAGRVGLPKGSMVISSNSNKEAGASGNRSVAVETTRRYVDNPMNRRLGRVDLVVGSAPISSKQRTTTKGTSAPEVEAVFRPLVRIDPEDDNLQVILQQITQLRNDLRQEDGTVDPVRENQCEAAIGIVHRHEAALTKYSSGLRTPEWVRGGEVINFSDIALGEKIGGGGFGDVFVGVWKSDQQVAIKKLRVQRVSQAKKEQFQKEVEVFSSLSHPSIVKFFGVCVTSPNLAIIMEFMAAGSLYDILHVEVRPLTQTAKFQMVTDCLSAIAYLHDRNITHRDVKSMNIMVTEDHGHCKLGDFGLALKEETRTSASVADHGVVGTLCYSPPEVVKGKRLTMEQFKAVDVYSMTVVVGELLSGKVPYKGMNQHQVRRLVLAGIVPFSFTQPDLGLILSNGMKKSATERPSATDFLVSWDRLTLQHSMGQLNVDSVEVSSSTDVLDCSTPSTTALLSTAGTDSTTLSSVSGSSSMSSSRLKCCVCQLNPVANSFNCGHLVCGDCLPQLTSCPQCRGPVDNPRWIFI